MPSGAWSSVSRHIAIVMDGNGRWATKRFLPRLAGHKKGVDALRRCVRLCIERGVAVLTVFAFSSENWNRPQEEVSGLMDLMALALTRDHLGRLGRRRSKNIAELRFAALETDRAGVGDVVRDDRHVGLGALEARKRGIE